jgi:tRNA nucleotidyltransferase/poly(A) polymerase
LDIVDKVVSAVGHARDRFNEDRLRVFRAIRFACQLGFEIDQEICDAIYQFGVTHFDAVTKEMMHIELYKAFSADSYRAANYLFQFPILWQVIKERGIWLRPTLEEKPM